VGVFRTIADQQQEGRRRKALDEAVQHRLRLGVDPVQIFEDEHERLDPALAQ